MSKNAGISPDQGRAQWCSKLRSRWRLGRSCRTVELCRPILKGEVSYKRVSWQVSK